MFDVVVYLLNENYREEIVDIFSPPGYHLHLVTDMPNLIRVCQKEVIDLIIIWPAILEQVSSLLEHLSNHQLRHLPLIAVVRKVEEFHAMAFLPIASVIPIPIPRKEFYRLLHQVLEPLRQASGNREVPAPNEVFLESSFMEAIRRIQAAKADALLTITDRGHMGRVYFREGRIVRASFRALEGVDALRKLAGLVHAAININYTTVKEKGDLESEFPLLLTELENQISEQKKIIHQLSTVADCFQTNSRLKEIDFPKNAISEQILELCKGGSDIHNLLVVMNQDNLEIVKMVQELVKKEALIARKGIKSTIAPLEEKKNFRKMINSLGKVFARSKKSTPKKTEPSEEISMEIQEGLPEEAKLSSPDVPPDIDADVLMKIGSFFRGLTA